MFDANTPGECTKRCWQIALAAAVVLALLVLLFGRGLLEALLIGIIIFAGVGVFLIKTRCSDTAAAEPAARGPAAPPAVTEAKPAPSAEPAPEAAPEPAAAPAPEPARQAAPASAPAAAPAAASRVKSTPALAGQAELAARKGSWKYQGGAGAAPAPAGAPAGLSAARGGKPDNLKLIKGVGPKLEQLLNSMGYYHFDQIAGWNASEIAWVDGNLEGFKGRVSRDNWVAQAKTLAAGGETRLSRRKQ